MKNRCHKLLNLDDEQFELVVSGQYAKKQLLSSSRIIQWSHCSRFIYIKKIIERIKPVSVHDYGSGDGTFLALCKNIVKNKFGFDIDPQQIASCKKRFSRFDSFEFKHTDEFSKIENNSLECITCMEVLEHCPETVIDDIVKIFSQKLAENGSLIISVPIEIGITLLFKQSIRTILGVLKIGQYQYNERYSYSELFKAIFATDKTTIHRNFSKIDVQGVKYNSCGHKGFNWKILEKVIRQHFEIMNRSFTPIELLGSLLNGQVWFVCRKLKS